MSIASASVSGTLLTGSSGNVTATINSITFGRDSAAIGGTNFACPAAPAATVCDSDVAAGTTLTFSNGPALTTQEGIDVASPITAASVGNPDFLTFSNDPNLVFSLTGISTYSNTNCAGVSAGGSGPSSCVVFAGSPLLLTCQGSSAIGCAGGDTLVSISVSGAASDGTSPASPYIGGFSQTLTANLPNGAAPTPVNIQNYFCPGGVCSSTAAITSSQSGSFTATFIGTPEPSSMAMMLVGAGLLALTARRRRSVR